MLFRSDQNEEALGRVIRAIRQISDIKIGIQLSHAGRKGSSAQPWNGGGWIGPDAGGWMAVAPSALAFREGDPPPRALAASELPGLVESFSRAVKRADRLGLDAIEIHGAHGYLLHSFLSGFSNQRTDEYGGAFENRTRFPLELFKAMRAAWPAAKPMGVRVSASEYMPGGWDIAETLRYGAALKALGCDWLDCSGGGISLKQQLTLAPGYQVPYAEQVRNALDIPTIAVGLITDAEQAEAIIASGRADMVALARGMLYDPRWAWHAAEKLGAQVRPPKQYGRAAPRSAPKLFVEGTA